MSDQAEKSKVRHWWDEIGAESRIEEHDVFMALTPKDGMAWKTAGEIAEVAGIGVATAQEIIEKHLRSGLIVSCPGYPLHFGEVGFAAMTLRRLAARDSGQRQIA